jgi:hypothetical protein
MEAIDAAATNRTARRLRILTDLYQQGSASVATEKALEKLLSYEVDAHQSQLHELQTDLIHFEQIYEMSSADFYQRFQAGQTDDRMDFIEWASLVQMIQRLETRIKRE